MADFQLGAKVINVQSREKGRVVGVYPARRGAQLYDVVYNNGNQTIEREDCLVCDIDISDPFERCKGRFFDSYSDYALINAIFKIENSNKSTISSLKASKTLFKAYQFIPLLKFINSDTNRLLVADEVGLGKTIEAGHIMLELKARRQFRNALIVCPKSLQEKWKIELEDKFGLSFKIYESTRDLITDLSDRDGVVRGIVNYEKIRSNKEKPNVLLELLDKTNKQFSIVVCDEAHKMRNSGTQTYKGATVLMEHAKTALFLTATPIMINSENLYNLLHLLNEHSFSDYSIFEAGRQRNIPFVKALRDIKNNNIPLPQIGAELSTAEINVSIAINEVMRTQGYTVNEYFSSFPVYRRLMDNLMNGEDTLNTRVQIQNDLTLMSPMSSIFSRTRKRDVTTDWSQAERKPHRCSIHLSEEEVIRAEEAISQCEAEIGYYINDYGSYVMEQGAVFKLLSLQQQLASSVYAYLNERDDLLRGIDRYAGYEDGKVNALVEIIEKVFTGKKKIIVFANFKKTLEYLKIRLTNLGYGCAMIHGDIKERFAELEKFRTDPKVHILLSSEVGSEGLDMQFCDAIVNYDLPWNPMIVEQRIGRIDRFGQSSPVVNIYNLVTKDSVQEIVYDRLLSRIGVFRESIGDLEAILEEDSNLYSQLESLEKELYCTKLSQEEVERKVEEIAFAIERERSDLKQIEEGLTNTLTNDFYFRDQINRMLNRLAYVTEDELKNIVQQVINKELSQCRLDRVSGMTYKLTLPLSKPKLLSNFLTRYQPLGEDYDVMFTQFKNRILDNTEILMTFSQEEAFANRGVLYVNMYHPIIVASVEYLRQSTDETKTTFRFAVAQDKLSAELHKGLYLMAVCQYTTEQVVWGMNKRNSILKPIVYDINRGEVIENEEVSEQLLSGSQANGVAINGDKCDEIEPTSIDMIRYSIVDSCIDYKNSLYEEIKLQYENERELRYKQTEENYNLRIESLKSRIEEQKIRLIYAYDSKERQQIEGGIRITEYNLKRTIEEKEETLQNLRQEIDIKVSHKIISLNLITVI